MQELEVTWPRCLAIWWLILWRGFVGAFLLGVVLGATITLVGLIVGLAPALIHAINTIFGIIASFIAAVVAVRMALLKQYSGFRLALVPTWDEYRATVPFLDEPAMGAPLEAQGRREPHF